MNLGCLLEILNVLIAIESIQETSLPMNKEEVKILFLSFYGNIYL